MASFSEQVDRGLEALAALQMPTGELPSFATPLDQGEPVWVPDQLNFITALGAAAVDEIDHPTASRVVDRAVAFLQEEREGPGLWRYWSRGNAQVDFTPPDADDTACCSIAVGLRGHKTTRNIVVLESTRADDGRFHTWLLPRGRSGGMRTWWALRDERRAATKDLRTDLWDTTEAGPDDIDAVVNANVCRYLGGRPTTDDAAAWVASIVRSGTDSGDRWHRSPFALWAAVADGSRRGVAAFTKIGPLVIERITDAVGSDGMVGTSYETGLALGALTSLGADPAVRRRLADGLAAQQGDDGCWPRDLIYFGGPREVFGWAAESLTTAVAVSALWRHAAPTADRQLRP